MYTIRIANAKRINVVRSILDPKSSQGIENDLALTNSTSRNL
jgi:hypothetical protein